MNLKIAFYFFKLDMSSGGAERMMLGVVNAMVKRGHEVHIISWDRPEANAFYPLPEIAEWHRLGFKNGWRDKIRRTIALSKLLKKIGCQAFVGFVMSTDKTVFTACLMENVPIIVAERNSPEMYSIKYGIIKSTFYKLLLSLANRIVVQLDAYKNGYPDWIKNRIETISNPVRHATEYSKPDQCEDEKWILLSVARLEDQKNLEVLIKAFSLLASDLPDWCLHIVGEGSKRPELEILTKQLSLVGRVLFPGAISEIEDEYVRAHLFCLPSKWEGFPNALAEAMAHGLPVVGFADCPGVNSLIEDGVDGILASGNGDHESLAKSLRILMDDPEKRAKMGQQAIDLSQRFKPERIMDQWERLIQQVAVSK